MGQILILDQNMINMIAAGEVIERPASVVKELMENSIDAGATKITASIEDGGRKLISVTDNGCGMDGDDLARAFEPHTTSKIKTSKDLLAISTLGFRGEALASIASVAQIRAVSRPRTEGREQKTETRAPSVSEGINDGRWMMDDGRNTKYENEANYIEIDCGNKSNAGPASADFGTTIQVRDLFYKLPARRKFLRSANTEMGHITEQFTRFALANAFASNKQGLDLTLIHNGRGLYRLLREHSLHQRIAELFSPEISESLIDTESSEKGIHIFALLGRPDISRTSNKFQYVFLNGRYIRDKFISHAIKEAYHGLLEPNRFPIIFLFIQMPYEDYDVNVHPTKIEVRFYNANLVHSQVLGCLREKLLGIDLQTQARLGEGRSRSGAKVPVTTGSPESLGTFAARHRSQQVTDAMAEFFKKHKPVQTQQQGFPIGDSRLTIEKQKSEFENRRFPNAIQIHDSFIVEQTDDGFVIIDQHALHERILYEDLCRRIQDGKLESQRLLIPESFEVTASGADVLKINAELIEKLGIELVPFGPRTLAVQAFPTLLTRVSPVDFVQDLIDLLVDKGMGLDTERLLGEILNMAACKAAIKAGQKLSDSEIEQLLKDKEHTERASRCPHGRPTTIKFLLSDLEKQFKRT